MTISERQEKILSAIIKEFMSSAEAVGSSSLVEKYSLKVSPATVRNEMAELTNLGYLVKEHSSSGRLPTDLGFRYYVKEMMKEREVSNGEQVKVRMFIYKKRFSAADLFDEILTYLTNRTHCMSIALVDDKFWYKGMSLLPQFSELRKVDVLEKLIDITENVREIRELFSRRISEDVCILIGEEFEVKNLDKCSVAFTEADYISGKKAYIGVLGPRRMRYDNAIPALRYIKKMVEESVRGW
ncbi:hypothetical protein JW887_02000 [Candidatus Dojkabacteria bacterium]|nr:hypothetical protein [Candidatus Dojkabacteria bacterium]